MSESENKREGDVPPPEEIVKAAADQDGAPAKLTDTERASGTHRAEQEAAAERKVERTRASGWWAGLIIAAIVLIFLLIFILQNVESVDIEFLMFSGSLPLGVAMLLAAIAGILVVAIPGVARMIQLRRHHKH